MLFCGGAAEVPSAYFKIWARWFRALYVYQRRLWAPDRSWRCSIRCLRLWDATPRPPRGKDDL